MSVRGRRALMVPVVVIVEVAVIVTAPLTLLLGALTSAVAGSSRAVRSVALVIAFALIELSTLIRIRRGVADWDELAETVLGRGYEAMNRILDLDVSLEEGSPAAADLAESNGLIVLSRHCGPGDTLFIAWLLANHYGLRLRIVLKDTLRWEPTVNLAGDHLGMFFVQHKGTEAVDGIRDLASGLTKGECLLLFPEGGNFTWPRWRAAVARLAAHGDAARARRARGQTHTLPVRPGGAVAALEAATTADVLLLAHSGLSHDGRDRPWWQVPVHQELTIRTILIPARAVPRDAQGARRFLDTAWARVDTWVEGHADLLQLAAITPEPAATE
jgi:1-acyl-sn-glycerol-3-phosphate acyltransferase